MAESQGRRTCGGRLRIADVTAGALRLRVIGSSSAVPRPGCACSCYLVETAQTRVILDCGTGSLQSLRRYLDPLRLDAVVVSHFHPDHVFDLVPLRYLRAFAAANPKVLDVFIPAGQGIRLQRLALAAASSEGERFFARSMKVREYDPRGDLRIGSLQLTFGAARHYIEAYAIRVSDGRAAVTYSSDTAPCDAVVELARGSDLFLCECALGASGVDREPRGHSSAAEAAQMAARAGVKHLVLTHYGDDSEPGVLSAAARARFGGSVTVAEDGWCVTL